MNSQSTPILTFRLNQQIYALPIENVLEVAAMMEFTPIDSTQSGVLGMINRRGLPIPLLDLRQIFNTPNTSLDANTFFVVVLFNRQHAALIVDELMQVVYISEIQPTPKGAQFVKGIVNLDGTFAKIVDLTPLFRTFITSELEA